MENRYIRQETFIGKEAQERLRRASVAVIGLGALGSVVAELLARAGVGKLIIADKDVVDITNLQRQVIFTENDILKPKAVRAREYLNSVNSDVEVIEISDNINNENLDKIKTDVIVDCTDNFQTRFLLNEFCAKNKIPLVHGSAVADKGYVFVVKDNACLSCIYSKNTDSENCQSEGILNLTSSIVGSIQANEVIKILINSDYENNLLKINVTNNDIEKIKVNKNKNCNVCKGKYELLNKTSENIFDIKLCKTKAAWTVNPKKNIKIDLNKLKSKYKTLIDTPILVVINADGEEIIVHNYGEIMFKTLKDEKKIESLARKIYEDGQQ